MQILPQCSGYRSTSFEFFLRAFALVLRVIVYVVCVISNYADKSRFMRIFAGVHTCAALLE